MKSLPLALPLALSLGCGVVVSPEASAPDAALADSTALDGALAPDVLPTQDARADAVADARPGDAGPRRPRSIVRISTYRGFRDSSLIEFGARGVELPTDPPEIVGGCWLIAARLTNLVSAGTVTAEWNSRPRALTPEPNEYRMHLDSPIPWASTVTVHATGSEEFPAFSVDCGMPDAMPSITAPPSGNDVAWDSSTTMLVRWEPTQSSEFVLVSIGGVNTLRSTSLAIHCIGPLSRGVLAIPSEALRQVDDFPESRSMSISSTRVGTTTVGNATIEAWCSIRANYTRQYTR